MESVLVLLSLGIAALVLFRVFKYKFTKFNRQNIGLSVVGIIVGSELTPRPLSHFFILLFILLLTFLIVISIFKK